MSQIDASDDPHSLNLSQNPTKHQMNDKSNLAGEKMKEGVKILGICDPAKQPSLESENIPDPMDAEQTWPTEEELKEAEGKC